MSTGLGARCLPSFHSRVPFAKMSILATSSEGWQRREPWKTGSAHRGGGRLGVPLGLGVWSWDSVHQLLFFFSLESYSIAGSEGSVSASAASGLGAPSGLSSHSCSPAPPGPVTGLRRWLDHSQHCLSVETEADSGQTGQYEVSREQCHRSRAFIQEGH